MVSLWCCCSKDGKFIPQVDRFLLTQKLIKELGLELDPDLIFIAWWWNTRPNGGLRLTDTGFHTWVTLVGLEHWQFDIADSILTPRNLLALDRFMTCPYYLKRQRRQHSLILFGDQESTMASLYGDVARFIESLEP